MSDNPFSNPYSSPNVIQEYYPPQNFSAEAAIRGPATGLIVVSIVWLVIIFGSLVVNFVMVGLVLSGTIQNPNPNPGANPAPPDFLAVIPGIVGGVLQLALHSAVLFGAMKMRKLRNLGLAYTAAIISVIPCCSGCYVIGIPFGIWALVTLNKPEVSSSFR